MAKTASGRLRTYADTGHRVIEIATNSPVVFSPDYPTDRTPWVNVLGERLNGTECRVLPCSDPECGAVLCKAERAANGVQ